MNYQPSDQCAICSHQPEDMLILSCSHNLCLDCATQLFTASSDRSFLQCQICFANTPLDSQTVKCLSSLGVVSIPPSPPPPPQATIPKSRKERKGTECLEHKQPSLYFCFDCQNGQICSECILGAAHAGHTIMTIKKASKVLSEKINEHSRQLESFKLKLLENSQVVKQMKEHLISDHHEKQTNLKALFQSMIKQVSTKFNQLNTDLQNFSRRSVEILDGALNSLNQKLDLIALAIRQNKEVIQHSQQQQILKRYCQLQVKKSMLEPEVLPNLAHSSHDINLITQTTCFTDLNQLLNKLIWARKSGEQHIHKENKLDLINSIRGQASLLDYSYQRPKLYNASYQGLENEQGDRQYANSVSKYSGIKGSSRRLELSRSMNNATNIINKLQERARK